MDIRTQLSNEFDQCYQAIEEDGKEIAGLCIQKGSEYVSDLLVQFSIALAKHDIIEDLDLEDPETFQRNATEMIEQAMCRCVSYIHLVKSRKQECVNTLALEEIFNNS